MNLVDELIKDHADLVGVLSKVKAIGISNNESRSILSNAKNALIGHLKKEDAKFYPPLKQAAETDKSLKILLDIFGKDMDEVTHAAMEFFDKQGFHLLSSSNYFVYYYHLYYQNYYLPNSLDHHSFIHYFFTIL